MEKEYGLIKKKARAKRDGNKHQIAEVTKDLGDHYFQSKNFDKALEAYSESVETYEILGDKLQAAIVHRMIGEVNSDLGKFESALKHQYLHLDGAKELNNEVELQRGWATLGRTYFRLAHTFPEKSEKRVKALANARQFYNKSILLCNEKPKGISKREFMKMRARLLLNQGLVQEAQMEPDEGINLIKSAIEIFSANKFSEDLHRAYLTLAGLYHKQGEIDLALKILDLAAKAEKKFMKVDALQAKAELFLKIGQWQDAREVLVALYPDKSLSQSTRKQLEKLLRIAVTLCRGEDKLRTIKTEQSKLKLYEDLGDAAAAAQCHNKALKYYKIMLLCAEKNKLDKKIAAALVSLAETFKDAGRYEEALHFAQRELKMCSDPREACGSALLVAELLEYAGSMSVEIIKMYMEALSKAKISGNQSLEATVLRKYLQYLETQRSETKMRLNLLLEQTPDVESDKELPNSQNIGADICLDELSDIDHPEDEKKTQMRARPRSTRSERTGSVKRNAKGETQLHTACIRGNIERVQKLLDDGHPTNVRDNAGWTPLHEAANHGFVDIVKLLISAGADVNDSSSEGITPLHDAAGNGQFAVMRLLMKKGASIHARTKKDESILDSLEELQDQVKNWTADVQFEYNSIRRILIAHDVERVRMTKRSVLVD